MSPVVSSVWNSLSEVQTNTPVDVNASLTVDLYLYVSTLLLPQDLKPSNLAVNEDCELKVSKKKKKTLFTKSILSQCDVLTSTHSLVVTLLYIDCMYADVCHTDPGFRFGKAHRWWNDRICCHTVVPSSRDYAELDALQHDRYPHKFAELRYFCACVFSTHKCVRCSLILDFSFIE